MRFHNLLAGVAFASAAAAQFVFPDASASLQVNKAIQIQWNKAGLQAPLSINLVPAGATIRQDVVLKQVAVNIGNAGILQWTADETITAFPKFAMVIIDARAQVVVSQPFVIQSLTRQPTQPIDLGNGNGGGKNGNKQNGDKAGKPKNEGNDKDKNKDANKDGKKEGNKDSKKEDNKEDQQKEKVTDKEESNEGSNTSLLPLPGLPASDEAPVSLKPLPTVASGPASTQVAAPASSTAKSSSRPATKSISQETASISKTTSAVPEPTSSTSPTPEAGKEPAAAQPAQNGFTTLQPSAEPTATSPSAAPAEESIAAALPDGVLKANAIVAGGSFQESTSGSPALTALPSLEGQETITTAITPRPARFASNTLKGLSESLGASASGEAKPTVLSESGEQRHGPGLVLGLLGAVACLALL